MDTQFADTLAALNKFSSNVIRLAKIELGARRTIIGRRTKWKGRKPISSVKVNRKGIINASGTLSKSLSSDIEEVNGGLEVKFEMEDYGKFIDEGRKAGKVSKNARIDKWAKKKPLKPRVFKDGKMGGYAKDTQQARKAMDFMIRRKIQAFGYEKTEFFTEPFNKELNKLTKPLEDALADDLAKSFEK